MYELGSHNYDSHSSDFDVKVKWMFWGNFLCFHLIEKDRKLFLALMRQKKMYFRCAIDALSVAFIIFVLL